MHKKLKFNQVNPLQKVEKITTPVDTIKKGKEIALESNDEIVDTLIVEKGKFKLHKKNAHASYYANKFNGRRTASGKNSTITQ